MNLYNLTITTMECGAQSLVDAEGLEAIQVVAEKAKRAALDGNWENSTHYWAETEWVVIEKTHGVDFYNIHQFQDYWGDWTDEPELQLMLSAGRGESQKKSTFLFISGCFNVSFVSSIFTGASI